jgi:hypothetical protein
MSQNECGFNLKSVKDGDNYYEKKTQFPQWNIVRDGETSH